MIGYTINQRGRYKCNYCDHPTYKTGGGITTHLDTNHKVEVERDALKDRVAYLDRAKAELGRQLAEATKPKPEPKTEYWYTNVFCTACKWAFHTGIPKGYSIESTRHSHCGNVALLPVMRSDI